MTKLRSDADRMRRRELYDAATGLAGPRLLPWTTPDGNPCYLSTDGRGYLSTLADSIEAVQLGMGEELLEHVREVVAPRARALSATALARPSESVSEPDDGDYPPLCAAPVR